MWSLCHRHALSQPRLMTSCGRSVRKRKDYHLIGHFPHAMHVTRYDRVTDFARITLTPPPAPDHAPRFLTRRIKRHSPPAVYKKGFRLAARLHLARLSPPFPYVVGQVHAPPLPCRKTSMPEAVPRDRSGEAATVPPVWPAHAAEDRKSVV